MYLVKFLKHNFEFQDSNFRIFYKILFFTTLLPYIPYILPFFPNQLGGFNMSGYAWIIMSVFSLLIFLYTIRVRTNFPYRLWLIWLLYLSITLFLNYSFYGLQLTLQYALPIMAGVIASRFKYDKVKLLWLLQGLLKNAIVIFLLFLFYYTLTSYVPYTATNPMYLMVLACFSMGLYYELRLRRFLFLFFLLFLVPLLSVTRMAILVYLITMVLHFSNSKILGKIFMGIFSVLVLIAWVNSKAFKEKTFHDGDGNIFQTSLKYSDDRNINTNGRTSWASALEPGLKAAPWFGNGPRADGVVIGALVNLDTYETHNDYLSLRYNYGIVGLAMFLGALLSTFVGLRRISFKRDEVVLRIMYDSTLTMFIVLLLFMYSDNILKYTTWYTNYLFISVGICFSLNHNELKRT